MVCIRNARWAFPEAIAVGALCLSYAALVLLARNMDPAGAWAIVGAFWGLVGVAYFAATSRRRG